MSKRTGFIVHELLAAACVLIVLLAMAAVMTREGRRQGSLGDNLANLKQFADGTAAYGADNEDRVWTFTWRAGVDYGFGGAAPSDTQAAANQAIDIIRRRGNRPDMTVLTGWFPHILYSHLVLADYLGRELPAPFLAGPEDRLRLLWQSNPTGMADLPANERPDGFGTPLDRWAYSSSYDLAPAFYAQDARLLNPERPTIAPASSHNLYIIGPAPFGDRRLHEVRFPGQKVMMYEQFQRHFGPRHVYFGYASARVPTLWVDGSARVAEMRGVNHGYNPNSPLLLGTVSFSYSPQLWEPPTLSGAAAEVVFGRFRWTRSGLRGRDRGPEVPWVD